MEDNKIETGVETPNTQNADYEAEIKKLKDALSKSNSENAEWKRKFNSKLTEEEQVKAQQEERNAYIKSLEDKIARTELGAELSKSIKDEKVLNGIVDSLIGGNNVDAIRQLNKYIETRVENAIKEHDAELLRSNPVPPPTTATGGITKEQFNNMTVAEKSKLYTEDIETYKRLLNS